MVSIDTKKMAAGNRVIIKLSQRDYELLGKAALKRRCTLTQAAKTLLGEALDNEVLA